MEKKNPDTKEKIILPKNLQREMMKFFLRTSMPKNCREEQEKRQSAKTDNMNRF